MDLPSAPAPLPARLAALLAQLEAGLVERRQAVRLVLLAALAGEHSLLIGPPGTAKSALARRLHLAFADTRYFERLLTRFTVPEELFGPLSIRALEEDRYERHTAGFLPDAGIAFIDEVFKANSAILNALLTLLNEREFDNGAGRVQCPLISVVGASNEVPADEVGEAFFDRFLLRIPVQPVSAAGFAALLALDPAAPPPPAPGLALDAAARAALASAAARVRLPAPVGELLAALRAHLAQEGPPVSDRRWVKLARLLRWAAASEGREAVEPWHLSLLPPCLGADAEQQAAIAAWLETRLGLRQPAAPERLSRVVEAFEAQLEAECNANDLDYDEEGRLRLSTAALDATASDGKGASQVLRISRSRPRRYGALHIAARCSQLDALLARIDGYRAEVAALQADLARHAAGALWLDEDFAAACTRRLAAHAAALEALAARSRAAHAGFAALPPLGQPGDTPAPVAHEALDA